MELIVREGHQLILLTRMPGPRRARGHASENHGTSERSQLLGEGLEKSLERAILKRPCLGKLGSPFSGNLNKHLEV